MNKTLKLKQTKANKQKVLVAVIRFIENYYTRDKK